MQLQLVRGERHHARGERGVGKRRDVHLPQRDDEPRVDRQQQQEIHPARAHQLGQVRAVDEEERLVDFLDEIARAGQQHHLPNRPRADGVGLGKNDADERELQSEPAQLHENPEQEVALEGHLARDGGPPQRAVDGEITPQIHAG